MKAIVGITCAILLGGGCSIWPKPSVTIQISPASVRGVPPDRVAQAKHVLALEMVRRGFVITNNPKGADYVLYTQYDFDPSRSPAGRLIEVHRERNRMKEGSLGLRDSLPVFPKVTDDIAGATP